MMFRAVVDEDVRHDEAVQAELDREIPAEAARALYRAAKIALARGNLEAITEHMLRKAVKQAEEL